MIVQEIPIQRRSSQTPPPDNQQGRFRILLIGLGMLMAFGFILISMFDLQIVRQNTLLQRARANLISERRPPALRGLVFDRNGEALILNAPEYQVGIIPARLPRGDDDAEGRIEQRIDRIAIYNRLANMLNLADQFSIGNQITSTGSLSLTNTSTNTNKIAITAGDIFTKVFQAQNASRSYEFVVLAERVPPDLALIIQEQAVAMPGVVVQTTASRIYPHKELLGNILGYVGKIPAARANDYPKPTYDPVNDKVGITGIEAVLEEELRGVKGLDRVELDVSGEEIRRVGESKPPTDGHNVRLTLDMRLQRIMEKHLTEAMKIRKSPRAAAVALNPNTGEVLGMVSFPGYDNNLFVRGISQKDYDVYAKDEHTPLINHALADLVPPGSIFKIVTTAALLEEGTVTPNTTVNDPGIFVLPNKFFPDEPNLGQKFYCWLRTGHGPQRINDALRNSCDTYFYKTVGGFSAERIVGMEDAELGPLKLEKWARHFSVGSPNGVEVGTVPGRFPTAQWVRRNIGNPWTTGDSYNLSIGQGYLLVTPLEMANMIAITANGGTFYQPQLVREVVDAQGNIVKPFQPKPIAKMPISPPTMNLIRGTLLDVLETGTAKTARIPGFQYAGKTGTAEFCDDIASRLKLCYPGIAEQPTHAWFVAYAPAEKPQIAIAVYVWNGGQGSGVAAPVVQRIVADYFNIPLSDKDRAKIESEKTSSE
ncbi:MAG: penicillin-binding protein 2 [Anaerolineae bacterium]|nr:penicillin-binding protein 2 [Anaerolineae bacterium]